MFTVLSNTRNSNLFLIGGLAIAIVVLLTFAVAPAISVTNPAPVAAHGLTEAGSDYYLRHSELRISPALAAYIASDFYLRHPEWASNIQNAAIPVTGDPDMSDYFQRQREQSVPAEIDRTGLYQNYPGAWVSRAAGVAVPVTGISATDAPLDECVDVSVGELAACRLDGQTPDLTPGLACESPVDCR